MTRQMYELMHRRSELLARISSQREQIAETGKHWRAPLAFADNGLSILRFLRSNPVLVGGATALLVFRRRRFAGLVTVGWKLWKLYKSAMPLYAKVVPRSRQ